MVVYAYRLIPIIFAACAAMHCNLEVGNPDHEYSDAGKNPGFNRLSLAAVNYTDCSTGSGLCASVDIKLYNSGAPAYRFEITEATLQLSEVTVKPYAAESTWTLIDPIKGGEVVLSEYKSSTLVSEIDLVFASQQGGATKTYSITGNLVTLGSAAALATPLKLEYSGDIAAIAPKTSGDGTIDGVTLDAATWFDFASNPAPVEQALKNLSGNVCGDPASRSCAQYRETLSRRVAEQIGKSAIIKKISTNQRLNVKTNLGGSK